MPLTKEQKQKIFAEYQHHATDTGSPEVQIAALTEQINHLTEHLKANPKDFSTRRGLMKMVGQRRQLQNYLKKKRTPEQYKELLTKLNLRK